MYFQAKHVTPFGGVVRLESAGEFLEWSWWSCAIMCHQFLVCSHPSTLAKNDCFAISERAIVFVLFASHIFSTNPEKTWTECANAVFFQHDLITGSNNNIIISLYNHYDYVPPHSFSSTSSTGTHPWESPARRPCAFGSRMNRFPWPKCPLVARWNPRMTWEGCLRKNMLCFCFWWDEYRRNSTTGGLGWCFSFSDGAFAVPC